MDQANVGEKNNNLLPGIIVIAIIAVGIIAYSLSAKKQETSVMPKSATETTSPTEANMVKSAYKNGSYSAVGNYMSPGGEEQIDVKITLKDGKIVDAEVVKKATRPNSVKFQGIFITNYKQFVIGKNIDEVKLDKVSGSSLTPKGFNDAIEKIKAEAKS